MNSMPQPTFCAVMLTRDRPELAAKAIECFERQTLTRATLYVHDTGDTPLPYKLRAKLGTASYVFATRNFNEGECSIGSLRNLAISHALHHMPSDILIHWDDDDWSHPNRIAE